MSMLKIEKLSVAAGDQAILKEVDLDVAVGEVVVIMGPNGSGKSTLANTLLGHPAYTVTAGRLVFNGQDITASKPEERAALGLFMTFQQPREIAGLDFYPFLFDAYRALASARGQEAMDVFAFKKELDEEGARLHIGPDWSQRSVNQGFSGGEKKKSEMLQLALFKPTLAVFDEIDSGLDVDALEIVGQAIKRFLTPATAAIVVTHYQRILKHVRADKVVVMAEGRVAATGGPELAARLEKEGFENITLND